MDELGMTKAFVVATKLTIAGVAVSPVLLFVRPGDLTLLFTAQLSALVLFGIVVVSRLERFTDALWFEARTLWRRRWLTAAAAVALATGAVALVTLATSSALGLEPSLQFLQLLSALDIAWAAGALYYGVRWRYSSRAALILAAVLGVLCVYSIWNYLTIFGFTSEGGWLVDRPGLLRYVIPGDILAAIVALAAITWGSFRPNRESLQPQLPQV